MIGDLIKIVSYFIYFIFMLLLVLYNCAFVHTRVANKSII